MIEKIEKGRDKNQGDASSGYARLFDELVRMVKVPYLALQTGESEASCRVKGQSLFSLLSLSVSNTLSYQNNGILFKA